jgi:hypothetical protein
VWFADPEGKAREALGEVFLAGRNSPATGRYELTCRSVSVGEGAAGATGCDEIARARTNLGKS